MSAVTPLTYVCYRATTPPSIDGCLKDPAWEHAQWTDSFVDIEGDKKPAPRFHTRAKMIWDDTYLYIGAEMEEPQPWATLTRRDSIIYNDNDFEVFLDPDNDGQLYTEIEMNALNTVWDLLLVRPYRAGGPYLTQWDIPGIRTAVHIDGKLNDPSTVSQGWSVEIAIPWAGLKETAHCACPPIDGDQWRINFSRVEWDTEVRDGKHVKLPNRPEHNWVWSPQGVIDMHRPERWGVLQFSTAVPGTVQAKPMVGMAERLLLTQVWDAQHQFRATHGAYAKSLDELGIVAPGVTVFGGTDVFELSLGDYRIDTNQRFWRIGSK